MGKNSLTGEQIHVSELINGQAKDLAVVTILLNQFI